MLDLVDLVSFLKSKQKLISLVQFPEKPIFTIIKGLLYLWVSYICAKSIFTTFHHLSPTYRTPCNFPLACTNVCYFGLVYFIFIYMFLCKKFFLYCGKISKLWKFFYIFVIEYHINLSPSLK